MKLKCNSTHTLSNTFSEENSVFPISDLNSSEGNCFYTELKNVESQLTYSTEKHILTYSTEKLLSPFPAV